MRPRLQGSGIGALTGSAALAWHTHTHTHTHDNTPLHCVPGTVVQARALWSGGCCSTWQVAVASKLRLPGWPYFTAVMGLTG